MESVHEDAAVTISRLRQDIKDRNKDIHLAATVGKELLEKTEKLSENVEALQSENEVLRQEKYSLQLDLETQVQTVNSQASELELQRKQYDNVIKQLEVLRKESVTQKQHISNLKKEKLDFEKTQEDLQQENHSLKKRINSLEHEIQRLRLEIEASVYPSVVNENIEPGIDYYKSQNNQLNEALSEVQCELESAKLAENRWSKLVKELEEGVYERDKELASYSIEIQKAKDYATELQGEVELLKLEQVDVNRRGNSVFGEIDDRRKIIEKEYKLLGKRYENLMIKFRTIKKELIGCKGQMSILFTMTSRSYQDSYIDKLEDQLHSAKREVESLTIKLSAMTTSLQQSREEHVFTGSGEYDYLIVMYEQAEAKIKQMENELINVHIQKITDNDELVKTRRQMHAVEIDLDAANLENMKLRHKIKELTLTVETEICPVDEAEIVVREFDPNKLPEPKPGLNSETHKEEVIEKKPCEATSSCDQLIEKNKEIHPLPTSKPPSRPVLQNFNESATKSEACQSAGNSQKEKTKKFDHIAYLDSTPYKQNFRTFSRKNERKEGQCAQQ